jgi:hypothetical protein
VALLRSRSRRAVFALVAIAAGCAVMRAWRDGEAPLAFSHRLHVGDQALECANCHADVEVSDAPGMPAPDTCSLCHDEIDPEKPAERHVASLFSDEIFLARHAAALDDEVIFSHLRHVNAGVACADCHAGIEKSERILPEMHVPMAACTDCHERRSVVRECATCHTYVDTQWAPESHERDWTKAHGPMSRGASMDTAASCSLCHAPSTCATCHLEREPDDHDHFFRVRGHGLIARMDRDRCAACHQPDSCDRCHDETRPLSHVGPWGSPRSTHCLGCHQPLAGESCALCHQATPSHALAAPKPPDHTPAMNCRQCHGLSAPLPHVEKGDDCNACHL